AKNYKDNASVNDLVNEMTIGVDLTLRDLQQSLQSRGHAWLLSKGFLNSAILGKFIPFSQNDNKKEFSICINEIKVQRVIMDNMIFDLQLMINYIGNNIGLKKGDIIFTGTPAGVGSLNHNDRLSLMWGNQELGNCIISLSE